MDHAIEARHREAAEEWRGILVYPPHTPGDAIEDLAADFARFEASLKTTPTELREAIFGAVHPVIVRNTPSVGRSCIVVTDEIVSAILTLLEKPHAEADRVSVPSEPTRQWAVMLAEIRQGQSSTPRCEPPGEADIQAAARMIGMVLRAAEALTQERS